MPDRTSSRAPTPAALLVRMRRDLAARGDPSHAEGMLTYFKKSEPVFFYGTSVPETRTLARGYAREVRGVWTVREAVAFAGLAAAERESEAKFVGFFLLARFQRDYPRGLVTTVRSWLVKGWCSNWALVDALSAEVLAPLIRRHPSVLPTILAWHASKSLWLRRAAVVPLASLVRRGEHLDEGYAVITALLGDKEDLIHKACGWILREAGKTDRQRLVAYLRRHGPRIPRTTLRYAIEHLPPTERKRMLAETRG